MNRELIGRNIIIPEHPTGLWYLITEHAEYLGFAANVGRRRLEGRIGLEFDYEGCYRRCETFKGTEAITLDEFFSLKPEPAKKTITLELTEEQEASVRAALGES